MAAAAHRVAAGQSMVNLRVAIAGAAGGFGSKGAKRIIQDLHRDLKQLMDQK